MGLLASPEDQLKKKQAQLEVMRINNDLEKQKAINKKLKKQQYDGDLNRLTA